ncbi:MAG: ectonucleotide pyrophosphatase/phosphodiesterase [Bryobacteraceae bacterium]
MRLLRNLCKTECGAKPFLVRLEERAALFALPMVLLLCAAGLFGADASGKPYVLLIGLDGFRFDYAQKFDAKNIAAFRDRGSSSEALIPCYPSLTFPNFYTLATGLYPEHHGIVANKFWDPARNAEFDFNRTGEDGSWYGGTPVWVLAEQQGMRTAAYFWPGTGGEIQHVRPSFFYPYDGATTDEVRVRQVLDWFRLPEEQRPHLVIVYFPDVDAAGHKYGPDSAEERAAVAKVDGTVGGLLESLRAIDRQVNVVIVSDHGMLTVERGIELNAADFDGFRVEGDGSMVMLYSADRALVESAYNKLRGKSELYEVYRRRETPAAWHYSGNPRIGDLLLVAKGPYTFVLPKHAPPKGMHGYDPAESPAMRGIFYAAGPGVRAGMRLPAFPNTNVFPFLVRLLRLRPPTQMDGMADGRLLK